MARALLPNSTQIPDVILDFWLSELSGAELKVVFYIARRTYGFGKESDNISLTQICSGITKRDGTVLDTGTGLSRSSVARAVKTLEEQGIILRKLNLSETSNEHEESTYSLNLNWQPNRGSGGGSRESDERGGEEVVPKSNHPVSKGDSRWSQNRTTPSPKMKPGVVPKSNPQETDQETVQETAASGVAAECGRGEGASEVKVLAKELEANDLNGDTAERYARTFPEESRRQLDLTRELPDSAFREGRGAYLARAIPGRYKPLKAYSELQQVKAQALRQQAERLQESFQVVQEARRATLWPQYLSFLRGMQERLKESHFDVYKQFQACEAGERAKYERLGVSARIFDQEEQGLQRFAEFFARNGVAAISFEDWQHHVAGGATVSLASA